MFSYLLYEITKLTIKVIRGGDEDEKIINDFFAAPKAKWKAYLSRTVSIVLLIVMVCSLAFSVWLHFSEDTYSEYASLKVVASSSMAKKHQRNTYLFENNLDTQLNMFDLVVTHPVPAEEDLQLYDVVVYQYDDISVIHRIVEIEEPNEKHPNERWFRTQGDAVSVPDREYVTYDQIKAIYKGERIEFVGSFVFFMRSPAGWLCVLLILFVIIATPIVEKKLYLEIIGRLVYIGCITRMEAFQLTGCYPFDEVPRPDKHRK
jgi:signal peptidase I